MLLMYLDRVDLEYMKSRFENTREAEEFSLWLHNANLENRDPND